MNLEGLQRLTERERAYLRLVARAMSSKEIALQYGVEPGTVDKALKSAMAKLGTSSRRAAARALSEADPQKLAAQPDGLEASGRSPMMPLSNEDGGRQAVSIATPALREEQAPYTADMLSSRAMRLPLPRYRGDANDLGLKARLLWIGAISLGIVIVASALVAISWGAARIAQQFPGS